jgi:hypothetical protein
MAEPEEAIVMTPKVTTRFIAISAAALFALAGAVSTAEAGRGGGHGGHGGGHGGHGGGHHAGGGDKHMGGGGNKAFRYGGGGSGGKHKGSGKHYAHGGDWWGKNDYHHKGKYGHYRRYGYPWYGLPLYSYGGGCGWLYSRAVATGSDYWWDRYYQCTGSYY